MFTFYQSKTLTPTLLLTWVVHLLTSGFTSIQLNTTPTPVTLFLSMSAGGGVRSPVWLCQAPNRKHLHRQKEQRRKTFRLLEERWDDAACSLQKHQSLKAAGCDQALLFMRRWAARGADLLPSTQRRKKVKRATTLAWTHSDLRTADCIPHGAVQRESFKPPSIVLPHCDDTCPPGISISVSIRSTLH